MTGNLAPASNVAYDPTTGALKWYNPATQTWTLLDRAPTGNELAVGQETLNRTLATSSQAMTSGIIRLSYFTARRSETVANVRTITAATAAGATPTLVRIGLYSVATNGDLTLIASTPDDTALYAAGTTAYTKAFSAPVDLVQGTRYALGVLVVTTATAPTLLSTPGTLSASEVGQSPRLAATRSGLTDLITPMTAGTLANTAVMLYGVVTP